MDGVRYGRRIKEEWRTRRREEWKEGATWESDHQNLKAETEEGGEEKDTGGTGRVGTGEQNLQEKETVFRTRSDQGGTLYTGFCGEKTCIYLGRS